MKNFICVLNTVLSFVLADTSQLYTQWLQANGSFGGTVRSIAISDSSVFAGTEWGIYRSLDLGANWEKADPNVRTIFSIVIDGKNIFAGATGLWGGLLGSMDNGSNWTNISALPSTFILTLFVIDTVILAGTYDGGVFRSTDHGISWTPMNSGMNYKYVFSFTSAPDNSGGRKLFAATDIGTIYQSTNDGTNWTAIIECPGSQITSLVANDSTLFAGTQSGIFRYSFKQKIWLAVKTGLTTTDITALVNMGSDLIAGTNGGGVFRSNIKNLVWTAINNGITNAYIKCFALNVNRHGDTTLYLGASAGGICSSTDHGSSWIKITTGLANARISSIVDDGSALFVGNYPAGICRSTDYGSSWTACNSGLSDIDVLSLAFTPNGMNASSLYAGTYNDGIFISNDHGMTWVPHSSGLTERDAYSLGLMGSNVFAGTWSGGVFRSTDAGLTWTAVKSGLPPLTPCLSFAVIDTNLFVGNNEDGVFRSTNNGTSWSAVNSGLTTLNVNCLIASKNWKGVANLFAGTPSGVFRSTNNGTSWTACNTGLKIPRVKSFAKNGNILFAGTSGGGIFISTDDGSYWTEVDTSLIGNDVLSLDICGPYLFAGTDYNGIWKRPLSEIITHAGRIQNNIPNKFVLYQNYPNPFNPSTTIEFDLPKSSMVSLTIYDILGKEVSVLMNHEFLYAGNYSKQWNAKSFSSGIYFYRLKTDLFSETKKLILLH